MAAGFQPQYILESELREYGLPLPSEKADIISLVKQASVLIDEHCGRMETDGNGSLVYSTYTERLTFPSGRNVIRVSYSPLAAVPASTVNLLAASGGGFYTGVQANTITTATGVLSPVISAKGRYGYGRRADSALYPDATYGMNLLQVASYFGGPPTFTDIDVSSIDFDTRTGELWIPAGIYLAQYTEIEISYNGGYDPRNMPRAIKFATAGIVKNAIAKVTTGVKSIQGAGKISILMEDHLIDETIERFLMNYKVTLAI